MWLWRNIDKKSNKKTKAGFNKMLGTILQCRQKIAPGALHTAWHRGSKKATVESFKTLLGTGSATSSCACLSSRLATVSCRLQGIPCLHTSYLLGRQGMPHLHAITLSVTRPISTTPQETSPWGVSQGHGFVCKAAAPNQHVQQVSKQPSPFIKETIDKNRVT